MQLYLDYMHSLGCDTTGDFKGLVMVKHLKKLQSMPRFIPVLARLGNQRRSDV